MPEHNERQSLTLSRAVSSDQTGVHRHLESRVRKHLETRHRKPPHPASVAAFDAAAAWRETRAGAPLIFDTGCGTGSSSRALAARHPDAVVIGIDKSEARLGRGEPDAPLDNLLLMQANLLDMYPLARAAGWQCAAQYALYPNPWPKAAALNKRWHGSPIFPDLIALGGRFELRSNWRIYLDEMQAALMLFGINAPVQSIQPAEPLTRFEAKYAASGHQLWCLQADLDAARWPA